MTEDYEKGGIIYVRRKLGEITVQDSVGGWLFDRFQEKPETRIRVPGEKKTRTYKELLEIFENGDMKKESYDYLWRKANPGSLSSLREERKRKYMKRVFFAEYSDLIRQISIGTPEMEKLLQSVESKSQFKNCLLDYYRNKIPEVTDLFDFRKQFVVIIRSGNLEDLATLIRTMDNVLKFHFGQHYDKTSAIYDHPEDYKKWMNAAAGRGTIFDLIKAFNLFEDKFHRARNVDGGL